MTTMSKEQFFRMMAGIDMPIYGSSGKSDQSTDHVIRVFQHAVTLDGKWIRHMWHQYDGRMGSVPCIAHDITPFMEKEGLIPYRYGSRGMDVMFYPHSTEPGSPDMYPDTLITVYGYASLMFKIYSTNPERAQQLKDKIANMWPTSEHPVDLLHLSTSGELQVSGRHVEKNATVSELYYPFLGKSVRQLFSDFMQSRAQVLLLIGPPGTGKSSFMRELICMPDMGPMKPGIVTRLDVMRHPEFFNMCADSEFSPLFLEDADLFIEAREDGNQSMSELLNGSDGIVKEDKAKLVISTNLPNLNRVDSALLRPGRCFGVLEFRHLTPDEALAAARHHGNTEFDPTTQDRYTLAEALNPEMVHAASSPKKSFGFVS